MKKYSLIASLYLQTPLDGGYAMQGGIFFLRVFSPALLPSSYRIKRANKAEVLFTATVLKSVGNDLHLSPNDRNIYLKGENTVTTNGSGNLVIGS
jgi:hypothetical protein